MPIDLTKVPERLTEAVATGNLIPFIGAGVSRQAKSGTPNAFPTWTDLLERLQEVAVKDGYITKNEKKEIGSLVKRGKFLMAAQALKSELPTDVTEHYLTKWYAPSDAEPSPLHLKLFQLRAPMLITTNYDLLLEDAYALEFKKSAPAFTFKDAAVIQHFLQSHRQWTDRPVIFKIHGSVASPSEVVLSEMDYRQLLYREPGYRTVLSAVFVTKVVLMIGFSFADPELAVLTESLREWLKHRSSPDYIVLPTGQKAAVEKKRLREDFGLEVIEYDATPGHPELTELVEHLATFVPKAGKHGMGLVKAPKKKMP
jgi:hypothetical protein